MDDLQPLLAMLEEELNCLIAGLKAALPVEQKPDTVAAEVDWKKIKPILAKLFALLEDKDAEAIDLFEESEALLRDAFGASLMPVEKAFKSFNLKEALSTLRSIANAHEYLTD